MDDIFLQQGLTELNVQMVPIQAATATVYGKLTDAQSGMALQGVTIKLNGTVGGYTNSSGNYTITDLEPGNYLMTFELAGYETESR